MPEIERREQFEKMGEENVRKGLDLGKISGGKAKQARTWLAEVERAREAEDRELNKTTVRAQTEAARGATSAAWATVDQIRSTNRIARIAIFISAVSLIVSIIAFSGDS